jgi:hypothetical protein
MRKFFVGLVVLGISSTMGTAFAAPGGTDRPLKVSGSGAVTVIPPQFSGTFHGTTTGKGTFSGSFVVAGLPPSCNVGSVPVSDSITLTAANGDTINQSASGTVCATTTNNFHQTSTYTITGGTGRYLTATGSGSFISDASFAAGLANPGTFTFTEDGTISY